MNDAAAMRVCQRLADLTRDCESPFGIDETAVGRVENVGQGSSLQPFHHQEIKIIVTVEIDKPDDIGVCQAATLGGFLLQCSKGVRIRGELG